jgi:hypothetical protein
MRRLEQWPASRPGQHRVELSHGERAHVMVDLADELTAIEAQLGRQQDCCDDMQETIARMRERRPVLRAAASQVSSPKKSENAQGDRCVRQCVRPMRPAGADPCRRVERHSHRRAPIRHVRGRADVHVKGRSTLTHDE